jgi:hypothetical protein
MHWLPLAIALTYRVLSLIGIVAILDWTSAHDLVRGAVVMGALWVIALTTDLQRGRQ